VVVAMVAILPVIRKRYLVLHDIDMTHDCRCVSTRTYLERHLKAKGISTIVNDRGRVGDHCVTWFAPPDNAQKIRYKVYNKLVQMLESADVRKSLGSRMEDIVANPDEKFTRTLLRHRDHGLSRLELAFYGSRLHPLAVYQNRMDDARRLLEGCTTFDYSYEQHWIERAELIKAMSRSISLEARSLHTATGGTPQPARSMAICGPMFQRCLPCTWLPTTRSTTVPSTMWRPKLARMVQWRSPRRRCTRESRAARPKRWYRVVPRVCSPHTHCSTAKYI
ncbi:hypothetical protein BKA57DRAFT_467654, partial [Linnemannia elongata]